MDLTAVNVAIGLVLLYLIVALMCTTLQEFIASMTGWRAKHLRSAIKAILGDPTMSGLAKQFYADPRIKALSATTKWPSYIAPDTFARTCAGLISANGDLHIAGSGPLAPFVKEAAGQADKLQSDLAAWFDEAMNRASGAYKRYAQTMLLVIGFALAVGMNISTLEVASALWTQPLLREAAVNAAVEFAKTNTSAPSQGNASPQDPKTQLETAKRDLGTLQGQLNQLFLPIGWSREVQGRLFTFPAASDKEEVSPEVKLLWYWLAALAGWALTALASSLGSQFWFNTLGTLLKLRATGEKS